MAESLLDLRKEPKDRAYAMLHATTAATLAGITDPVAGMATISSLVHHAMGFLWTGFYRVVDGKLLIGPYQGTLGCLEIDIGRGVCGTAARERRTVVVTDVSHFPGHIACDARARSEIVVPVFDGRGDLIAVFDIDSERPNTFSDADGRGLERMMTWFRQTPKDA
jgi:L-methionine (R)-S-oxide reductase